MTESELQVNECPVCDADNISYWEELSTWRCSECSYVFDGGDVSDPEIPSTMSSSDQSAEKSAVEWESRISVKDKSEANLVEVLSQTENLADEVFLPDEIVTRAGEIVTEAWKSNFMSGRTKSATVAAALYAASREAQQSVPPGVLAEEIETDKQTVKKRYTQLKQEQHLDIDPPDPEEYVGYICRALDLPTSVREASEELLTSEKPRGGNPIGIAAAGVYESTPVEDAMITLRDVSVATTLTKETIWRHASELRSEQ